LEGLVKNLDTTKFELYAFSTTDLKDDLTKRISSFFQGWHQIHNMPDIDAATLIYKKKIQILIDLAGHTAHNRLPVFSFKPSPVQLSWLGYPATTGLNEIDYILGDQHALPYEYDNQFTEKIWRLPQTYLCLPPPKLYSIEKNPPAYRNGFITFGSFNNLSKINLKVIQIWSHILKSTPNSKLFLKNGALENLYLKKEIIKNFKINGIDSCHLLLEGQTESRETHLKKYNKIDIALDTFPYPGVTTSFEATWMGVPIVSLQGNTFLSRTATSIAINSGLDDLVASNTDEYIYKAIKLASNLNHLREARTFLKENVMQSPLFMSTLFAKNFGDALLGMWDEYLKKRL
jgi:predicted O-linked N-acetylglucosamine transferase (SPINDLY family)